LFIARVAVGLPVGLAPLPAIGGFAGRLLGFPIEASPGVVLDAHRPTGRSPIGALRPRLQRAVDRRVPIESRGGAFFSRRLVRAFRVVATHRPTLPIILATILATRRGWRAALLACVLAGGPAGLEAEVVVAGVEVIPWACGIFGVPCGPLAARRLIALATATPPSTAAAAPPAAAPRFATAAVSFDPLAAVTNAIVARGAVFIGDVVFPGGALVSLSKRWAVVAYRRPGGFLPRLVGSRDRWPIVAAAFPCRAAAPVATPTAASGAPAVASPFVVAPAAGCWPFAAGRPFGRPAIDDWPILEAKRIGCRLATAGAGREIVAGALLVGTPLPGWARLWLAIERFRRGERSPLARYRRGRLAGRRGGAGGQRIGLQAQPRDDVGPIGVSSGRSRLFGLGATCLSGSGPVGGGLGSGGLGTGLVWRRNGAQAVGERGPRIVCFRHGSDGFLDNGGRPKGAPGCWQG
jgi:hypothetical protein